MQSFSETIAMFLKYGRTKEKTTSPFCVNRLALLGALATFSIFTLLIICRLLSIASIDSIGETVPL